MRSLGIDKLPQLNIDDLCMALGERRGRHIRLVPLQLPLGSPDGLWVSTKTEDFILFEQRLAPIHGRQVILHELGHGVCDHHATLVISPDASRLLLPSLNPEMVQRALGREHSQTEAEIEAEYVGSLLSRHVNSWTPNQTWEVPPELQELAERLSALEHPSSRKS
ncbi:hypothetical protein [Streptomyces sp. NPDC014746]|uniref:hypothetical protein n=1 Tax=Streptomyces sp. NPDC014746 TaxID=3364904 RepID=UPI003700E71C